MVETIIICFLIITRFLLHHKVVNCDLNTSFIADDDIAPFHENVFRKLKDHSESAYRYLSI